MSKEKQNPSLGEKTKTEASVLSLEQYLMQVKVNPGLVASFRYEARKRGDGLEPRTEEAWRLALEEQSNRTY